MYVIGNGESRRGIDISKLERPKVGCNAIMRECFVDHLVCVDTPMVDEALRNNVNDNTFIYTRRNWLDR